jgi:hypothetical protein
MARRLPEEQYLRLDHPVRATTLFNSRTPLRTSTRKARLFLCACCRRVWQWLETDANRAAVEAAERAADGLMRIKDLRPFYEATTEIPTPMQRWPNASANPAQAASWPFTWPVSNGGNGAAWLAGARRSASDPNQEEVWIEEELAAQCGLIHDLLGNPFRPVTLNRAWLSQAVVRIAQAVYDERSLPSGELDLARLAVLSDALEDAGCTDIDILSHLRSSGPHVLGCWAVDLLLGKVAPNRIGRRDSLA